MKREITLCDEERQELDEESKRIDQEDAVFSKRMAGRMNLTGSSLLLIDFSRIQTSVKQRRDAIAQEEKRRITNQSKLSASCSRVQIMKIFIVS